MAPTKKKKHTSSHDPYTPLSGDMSDSSKPRAANGVKGGSAPKMVVARRASSSASSSRDKATKKSSKRPPSKKQSRKVDRRDGGTSPPPAAAKRRKPKESASSRASYAGINDDSSDEDDGDAQTENSRLPVVRPFVHLPHHSVAQQYILVNTFLTRVFIFCHAFVDRR